MDAVSIMANGNAAIANVNAAAAKADAREALIVACRQSMRGYRHDDASEREIREYLSCAAKVYPEPTNEAAIYGIAAVTVVLLVGVAVAELIKHRWARRP